MSKKMVASIVCDSCEKTILKADEKTTDVLLLNSARMSIFAESEAVCVKKDLGPFHFCDAKCLIKFLQSSKTITLNCEIF